MTISKKRFELIICDEAQKVSPDGWLCGPDPVSGFAHALLKDEVIHWMSLPQAPKEESQ